MAFPADCLPPEDPTPVEWSTLHDFAVRLDAWRVTLNLDDNDHPPLQEGSYDQDYPFVFDGPISAAIGFETTITASRSARTFTISSQQLVKTADAYDTTTSPWTAPPNAYAQECLRSVAEDSSQKLFYLNDADDCLCKSVITLTPVSADASKGFKPASVQEAEPLCGCQSLTTVADGDVISWDSTTFYELFPVNEILILMDEADATPPTAADQTQVVGGDACNCSGGCVYLVVKFSSESDGSGGWQWSPVRVTRTFAEGVFSWQISGSQFARLVDQIDSLARGSCGAKHGSELYKASWGIGEDHETISGGGAYINAYCPVIADDLFWTWWVFEHQLGGDVGAKDRCPGIVLLDSTDPVGYQGNYTMQFPWLEPTNLEYVGTYDTERGAAVHGMYCEETLMLFYALIYQIDSVITYLLAELAPHASSCSCPEGRIEVGGGATGDASDDLASANCYYHDDYDGHNPAYYYPATLDAYHYLPGYNDPETGDPVSLSQCYSFIVDLDPVTFEPVHEGVVMSTTIPTGTHAERPGCHIHLNVTINTAWVLPVNTFKYETWGNDCHSDTHGLNPGALGTIDVDLIPALCAPDSYNCATPPI